MKISRDFACLAYMAFDCYLTEASEAAGVQRTTLHSKVVDAGCLPTQALGKGVGVTGQPKQLIDQALWYAQRPDATGQEMYFGKLVEHHLHRPRDNRESQRTKPDFHPSKFADAKSQKTKWWEHV